MKKKLSDPSLPQQVPEGFLFSDVESSQPQTPIYLYLAFGSILMFLSVLFLFDFGHQSSDIKDVLYLRDIAYLRYGGVLIMSLIGLPSLAYGISELWKNLPFHPAELIVPSYPLRLGEDCAVHYRRRLRKGNFARPARIEAKLMCDEWVQYTQGTDTVTKTHPIWQESLPTQTVAPGEHQASYIGHINIPLQGPPCISAEHNKIRWQLIIKLKAPGIPRACISTFLLKVLPESVATS
jgi:hypothetical protein